MHLCDELLCKKLGKYIVDTLKIGDFDYEQVIQTQSVCALNEIRTIIQNEEYDDFQIVEEIVVVFERYDIDAGIQHDFG